MEQTLTELKRDRDSSTRLFEDLNMPRSRMGRTTEETKETEDLTYTVDRLGLTDTHRTRCSKPAKHTFFSSVTLPRTGYVLDHNIGLRKFQRIEIILGMFSDHRLVAEKGAAEQRVGKGQELGFQG